MKEDGVGGVGEGRRGRAMRRANQFAGHKRVRIILVGALENEAANVDILRQHIRVQNGGNMRMNLDHQWIGLLVVLLLCVRVECIAQNGKQAFIVQIVHDSVQVLIVVALQRRHQGGRQLQRLVKHARAIIRVDEQGGHHIVEFLLLHQHLRRLRFQRNIAQNATNGDLDLVVAAAAKRVHLQVIQQIAQSIVAHKMLRIALVGA
mmetsp:Transcript_42051/g.69272  ORF Transcript_42051/g.69272 Transcript_42051/m.69272 type:complete len:205 (-) Transcript_42051:1297-1911(-)